MIIVRVKGFAGNSSRNGVNIFKSYTLGDPSVVGKPARVPSSRNLQGPPYNQRPWPPQTCRSGR